MSLPAGAGSASTRASTEDPSAAALGSVADARAALSRGEVTVPELVAQALDLAEATADLAAFTRLHHASAAAVAQARQAQLAAGQALGPLHGVPVVLKDNVAEAGLPNRAGSRVLPDEPAPRDATVTARLRAAGAVVIGRTNMHELAWGGTTDNPHEGTCRNPWDPGRVSAGSSGGTASAVAAGVVPVGLGTDTGGSIRLPSAVTNLTGLRPTMGAVPTDGIVPLAWTLDTVGPMGRSAADCRAVLDVIGDRHAVRATGPKAAGSAAPFAGLRVGVLEDHAFVDLQPGVERAVLDLLDVLTRGGGVVRPVRLPDLDAMVDALVVVDAAEPSAVHARHVRTHPELIGADVLRQLRAGEAFTAVEYLQAQRFRTHLTTHLTRLWTDVDVLLSPTLPFTAPRVGERTVTLAGRVQDNLVANMRFTALPSLTGTPALSLPAGLDERGLPVGAQLVGPAGSDDDLLCLGIAIQGVTGHHRRRPRGR